MANTERVRQCSTCRVTHIAEYTKLGWWSLSQQVPGDWARMGLFCSLKCLAERVELIRGSAASTQFVERYSTPTRYSTENGEQEGVDRG